MTTKKLSLVVACLVATGGCNGGRTNPTQLPSSSAGASISIAPATDLLKIKSSETFSATTISASGAQKAAAAAWTSDSPAIASVDAGGKVTGNASGRATITAQVEGLTGTLNLRVIPDYHGRWEGMTRVTACTVEGDWNGACADVVGSSLAMTLAVTQDRDAISGDVDFDGARGPISTSVQVDGRLVTSGALTLVVDDLTFDVALTDWDTASMDNQQMSGRFRLDVRHASLSGFWRLEGELASVRKVAGTAGATSGRATSLAHAAPGPLSERLLWIARRRR